MRTKYEEELDYLLGVKMLVEFKTVRGVVIDYSVVLFLVTADGVETIRVYDGAHGYNEMHRYTRVGHKQAGTEFLRGATLGEGMRAAIEELKRGYLGMIEGWMRI